RASKYTTRGAREPISGGSRKCGVCAGPSGFAYCRAMSRGLPMRMMIGLVLGVVLGVSAHVAFGASPALEAFVKNVTEPAGKIFLRLLFMLVIPLIVSGLSLGVAGLGDLGRLGRI